MNTVSHQQYSLSIIGTDLFFVIISGILLYLSGYGGMVTSLIFLAPIPLLYLFHTRPPWLNGLYALLTFSIGFLWTWEVYGNLPIQRRIFFLGIFALSSGVVGFVASWFIRRHTHVLLTGLIYPALCVVLDWVAIRVELGGFISSPASPLANIEWLVGISSIGGLFLVTFLVRLIPSALVCWVVHQREGRPFPTGLVVLTLGLTVFAMIYGSRYAQQEFYAEETRGRDFGAEKHIPPIKQKTVRMAAVAYSLADAPELEKFVWTTIAFNPEQVNFDAEISWTILRRYEHMYRRAANDGATIIGGPEYAVWIPQHTFQAFLHWMSQLAQELNVTLLLGYAENFTPSNSAVIATPDGKIETYRKYHLVPAREAAYFVRGTQEPLIVESPVARIGARICFDANFPRAFRTMTTHGVEVVYLPYATWFSAMKTNRSGSVFRAAENKLAWLGPEIWGYSFILAPNGQTLAIGTPDEHGETYLIVDVPLTESGTVYSYLGDWMLYVSGGIVLWACLTIRKVPSAKDQHVSR